MIKNKVKQLLQHLLGFDNFLFIFSLITIRRLYMNKHEKEFVYFLGLLPKDQLLLDIGANIGIMTVPMAKIAVKGEVFSFEPMPQNLNALRRVIKYHKLNNVTIFNHALGNKPGELKMLMPIINHVKMQGLSHVVDTNNTEEGEIFIVPVKVLDDMPELQQAKSIGGIKIDVENFEYEVLAGAKNLLLKHKPIIYCELWDNPKRDLTLNFLKDEIGYKVQVYDGKKLVPFTDQHTVNFVLAP